MAEKHYDLIVIGAGSGGVRASRFAAARHCKKVAVIESNRVGGTCVMRGCVPKKLLVYGAHYAEAFEDALGYGWGISGLSFNWSTLIGAKEKELNRLEEIYHNILRDSGVDEISGKGLIIDKHTVEVGGEKLTTENILVATGGWPFLPDIPGIENVITSNEALDLTELPRRMVIVGGGYIAIEFAGVFQHLGVEVEMIVRSDTILRGFDVSIRTMLHDELIKKGIRIRLDSSVTSIKQGSDGFSLQLDPTESLETDIVMYATGRRANTRGLGLEEAGVILKGNGAIEVNAFSQTAIENIYAIGDATDRINLTPVALAEGMAVVETI